MLGPQLYSSTRLSGGMSFAGNIDEAVELLSLLCDDWQRVVSY